MEAYKTDCHDCHQVKYWTGRKSFRTEKSEEREKPLREQCSFCGSKNVVYGLDHETELGQLIDAEVKTVISIIP